MTQSGTPDDPGRTPEGPPSWQQPPRQASQPSWQQAPQQPVPPTAPRSNEPPSWAAGLTSTRPVAGPAGYTYADVPNRTIAMVIDIIAMFVLLWIVGIVASAVLGEGGDFGQQPTVASLLVASIIGYAVWAAYFIYLWSAQRATLGMRVLGMQIGHESDGRSLTTSQAGIRFAILFGPQIVIGLLASFVPSLGLISFVGLAWLIYVLLSISQSPTKQGVHDRYAQSMVVKATRQIG